MPTEKKVRVEALVPKELRTRLNQLAKKWGTSASKIIEMALEGSINLGAKEGAFKEVAIALLLVATMACLQPAMAQSTTPVEVTTPAFVPEKMPGSILFGETQTETPVTAVPATAVSVQKKPWYRNQKLRSARFITIFALPFLSAGAILWSILRK